MRGLHTRAASPRVISLAIFAIAVFNVVFGVAFIVAVADPAWAADITRNLSAARDLAVGEFGRDRTYLYSPVAALLTIPATWAPPGLAIGGWLVARLAILAEGVRRETAGRRPVDRVAVLAAVAMVVPTLYDLMLGNVTIVIAAAVALVAWSRDRFAAGIAFGLVLATVPKPALVPVLLWMVLYRRRALVGAVVTAGVAAVVGLAIFGFLPYQAFADILRHPEYLDGPMLGNLALTALPPTVAIPIAALTIVGTLVSLRNGEVPGFIACLAAGLLIAPYTMAYGPVLLLLGLRPMLAVTPVPAYALAATGSIMVIVFLPAWALAWVGAVVLVPRRDWARSMPSMIR